MHLPGSRWKETNLVSAVHVLILLAMHLVGGRWKEIKLASAEHVLELFAMHLPGSRWEEHDPATQCMCSHRCAEHIQCLAVHWYHQEEKDQIRQRSTSISAREVRPPQSVLKDASWTLQAYGLLATSPAPPCPLAGGLGERPLLIQFSSRIAMHLPGSRWEETNLVNAVHVLILLGIQIVCNAPGRKPLGRS
jgi:hypothetical protein